VALAEARRLKTGLPAARRRNLADTPITRKTIRERIAATATPGVTISTTSAISAPIARSTSG
jgi:hypothetical protein